MKHTKYITALAMSLFALPLLGADAITVKNTGGNWSDSNTWEDRETIPSGSTASDRFSSLTIGTGKLILDSGMTNSTQYVNDIAFSGNTGSIQIDSGKTLAVQPTLVTGSNPTLLSQDKTLTVSGDGTFNVSGNNHWVYGHLILDAAYSSANAIITAGNTSAHIEINKASENFSQIILNSNSKVDINANITSGRINAHGGATVNIAKDTIVKLKQDVYINNKGTFTVSGTLYTNLAGNANAWYGNHGVGALNIGSKGNGNNSSCVFLVEAGGVANIGLDSSKENDAGVLSSGVITLKGNMNVHNDVRLFNKATLNMQGGNLDANSIIIANYYMADSSSKYEFVAATEKTAVTVNVTKSGTLSNVVLTDKTTTVTGTDANASYLYMDFSGMEKNGVLSVVDFTGLTGVGEDTIRFVVLQNYADGLLKVNNQLATDSDGYVKGIYGDALGNVKYFQLADGSISATAVPEPAEWAMIFGAIALGFVAYRRRK